MPAANKTGVNFGLLIIMLLLLLSCFSCVWLCATPQMAAHQAPSSLGFSRQEHWSGLPFPSPVHESESESEVAQSCLTLSNPWTAAYQAPPSMGFSRQEYWSGVPLPSPKVPVSTFNFQYCIIFQCMSIAVCPNNYASCLVSMHSILPLCTKWKS